jgi:putative copper export protein
MGGGLYFLNVTVHLLAAMVWLGGMLFFVLVGAPALREIDPPALRADLFRRLGERFRTVGWAAIGVLIVTGLLNLSFRGVLDQEVLGEAAFWATPFGRSLGWKLTAVTAMVAASALHDFVLGPAASRLDPGSPEAVRARRRAAALARASALIGLIVVIVAVRLARGG